MSGVFGVLDSKRNTEIPQLLAQMGTKMSHREWYVVETHCDEEAGMGLGWIGMGMLNKGPHPVWKSSGTVALVMAGELYNRDTLGMNGSAESDLHLSGVPAPEDFDGRVLTEYLSEEFMATAPVRFQEGDSDPIRNAENPFSQEEAESVEERLRAFGYIGQNRRVIGEGCEQCLPLQLQV